MQGTFLSKFRETCKRFPNKVAFTDGDTALSFSEINRVSSVIGSQITGMGLFNKPVVVFMGKSPEEIAAFLGVLKSGNHYVPIDEEMPARRIELILDNVKTALIICDETTIKTAEGFKWKCELRLYSELVAKDLTESSEEELVKLEENINETNPAYVMFTSGSTGIPKGVASGHGSLANYAEQLVKVLKINETNIFGEQAPLYFDASLKELCAAAYTGATVFLIPKQLFRNPMGLIGYLNEHKINTLCWVVSALTFLSAFGALEEAVPEYVHTVTFVGEVFPAKQFNIWRTKLPEVRFVNLYGPTECTGVSTYFEVPKDYLAEGSIPIGKPFEGTKVYLDKDGEILIGGPGVSLGYYNDLERTAEVFVRNPFSEEGELVYRTGDLGKFDEDGNLLFLSRKDYQIKHMGHRIELGEIEADVSEVKGVSLNACVYDKLKSRIVLFYVGDISEAELTRELKGKLQRYMLPNRILRLESLPRTNTGKIDRKTLETMI